MKKKLMIGLLTIAACHTHAYAQPYFVPNATPVSETIFRGPDPGKQQCNFFVWLPNQNRIWYDLTWASHLGRLNHIDSIIEATTQLLQPMLDSFATDGLLRRVEVDLTRQPALFRVITHTQKAKAYTTANQELLQVKVDQDTVRIKFIDENCTGSFVNLLLNNVADIKNLPPNTGSRSLQLVKDGLAKNYPEPIKNNSRHKYYAVYNLQTGALVSPDTKNYHAIRTAEDYLAITIVHPSLTYARGAALTGFSVGGAINYRISRDAKWGNRQSIGLYWEPQFAFSRSVSGKLVTDRNDFLTLRLDRIPNKTASNFELMQTFSMSYLVRRSGNVFEKNTMRLGVLGVSSGKLQLEPEVYFNDFFKNVSPGLKLSLKLL